MRHTKNRLMVGGMALLLLSGLSACNYAERRAYVREQPVQRTEEVITVQTLPTLKANQPLMYYTQQFDRMGYKIEGMQTLGNRQVYDLRKGNERAMVGLMINDTPNALVRRIDIQRYEMTQNPPEKTSATLTELDKLKPGKKPYEYISTVSTYGRVTSYNASQNTAAIELQSKNNQFYHVNMTIDPQRQTVTQISADRNIWDMVR